MAGYCATCNSQLATLKLVFYLSLAPRNLKTLVCMLGAYEGVGNVVAGFEEGAL